MKTKIILLVLLILIAISLITYSFSKLGNAVGPHGGLVKRAGDYNIEMKNTNPIFYAFLLDHRNKPKSNKGITCEVNFVYPDSTSLSSVLTPFEEDGFSMEMSSLRFYSYCKIYFHIADETVSAKFDGEMPIVQKRKIIKHDNQN